MGSEARLAPAAGHRLLSVAETLQANHAALCRFEFGAGSEEPGSSPVGLELLGGRLAREFWQAPGPLESARRGPIRWRRVGSILYLEWVLADDASGDAAGPAEQAYGQLLALAAAEGCPHLLRAWNFLPAINQGEGDQERYRQFCLGRARALEAAGIDAPELCAGTAIGGDDPHLRIMLLCGDAPGVNIENPRQVSAYRYPRIYGPRSPSFARATALPSGDGPALLMISGTASVVGHESLHVGDLEGQIDEIRLNLEALLAESARRLDRPGLMHFDSGSLMRVYVRHARDWPRIQTRLAEIWPEVPLVGLRGDICRSDLLLEVEAVLAG